MSQQLQALPHPVRQLRGVRVAPGVWTYVGRALCFLARACLLGVLCAAPWWYGGVELDTQVWLCTGLLTSLACWTASSLISVFTGKSTPLRLPTILVPFCALLLLGAVQLSSPFSTSTGAPPDANGRGQFSKELPNVSSVRSLLPASPRSHSIYPAGTRLEIARLGIAVIACFLGIVLFQESSSQVWLWGAFAVNGAALAFFGIVQQLSWNGKLYWTVPLLLGGQPFASYVNRNNAAGYLNLCLAGACGLVAWLLCRKPQSSNVLRVSARLRRRAAHRSVFEGSSLSAVLLAAVIAAGIVCSVSRGGVLAMFIAGGAVLLLVARTRGILAAAVLSAGIFGLGIGLVYWTGLEERFMDRWNGSVGDTVESGAQFRLANWQDAMHAVREFPLIGTGFGTYGFAYLPFQTWHAKVRFYNADNQFVENLVEGGWIGLGIMLVAIGLCLVAALRLIRSDARNPAGIVGLFAVISQIVSSLFDFGPTMSANMIALAVLSGAVTSRVARLEMDGSSGVIDRWLVLPELRSAGLVAFVGLAMLGYGLVQRNEIATAADCRTAWRDLPKRFDAPDALSDISVELAIQQLSTVLAVRPDDADAHVAAAKLWIYRYRQQAHAMLIEYKRRGGASASWTLTDPEILFHRIHELKRNNQLSLVEDARNTVLVRDNLIPAYMHLSAARSACPLMPGLDIQLALIAFAVDADETSVGPALRRAVALAPANADLRRYCDSLAHSAGLPNIGIE